MSDLILSFRGREIRDAELTFLRQVIVENPRLSRRALSTRVCLAWNWLQPNGQPCDMVCRSLMLRLHRAGQIPLPEPRIRAVNNAIVHRRVRAQDQLQRGTVHGRCAMFVASYVQLPFGGT